LASEVEDEATWARLAEMHCDFVQGYVFARPLPPDQFSEWLAQAHQEPGILHP
jgi:c-di-GMP-specific phosphodiesterase